MRGTYIAQGKEPKEGERKLYLAIEATSELAIQKAKTEVTRLIKEELVRLVCRIVNFYLYKFSEHLGNLLCCAWTASLF